MSAPPSRRETKSAIGIIFDGLNISATTEDASATLCLNGYSVSESDKGKWLAIRGGRNFLPGSYQIVSLDSGANTWTLDRRCTVGAGDGMAGILVNQEGCWHDAVPQYFDEEQPDNPGLGDARQRVLEALAMVEPGILKSLAETCFRGELLKPEVADDHDWYGPVDYLLWGHVRDAGNTISPTGMVFPNLRPLRASLVRWAKDEPQHGWNLCDHEGEPLDWIADAAVQTLVYWQQRGGLPKNLRWENLDLHCYRSLDSEPELEMFELERQFDAGAGFVRIVPEHGIDYSRLSARNQRKAKQKYKFLGRHLGLTPMQRPARRDFEWYALQTFLGFKLREIRERELLAGRSVGDPRNPDDVSAISHSIKKIADLVGFRR